MCEPTRAAIRKDLWGRYSPSEGSPPLEVNPSLVLASVPVEEVYGASRDLRHPLVEMA